MIPLPPAAPWEFSAPINLETAVPNESSPEGEALGRELARLTAPALEKTLERFPDSPRPCVECAFVLGTVPNRCAPTLMDAVKCVVEKEPFYCHMGVVDEQNPKRLCAGFVAAISEIA